MESLAAQYSCFTPPSSFPSKLCLALLFLISSSCLSAKSGPHTNLENLGFTLLQADPITFELPSLQGEKKSLKNFQGKWIFLAFWATWCGPCAEEMPALQALYSEYKNKGLSILAVSVDQDRANVESFAKEKSLNYPILLDADGTISSRYQASALPTLYVISPDWKLVGVMRGAREWSSSDVGKQIATLLQFRDYKAQDIGIKMEEEEGGALSLPNNLLPPEISATFDEKEFKKGESHKLTVSVVWKGNPKDYLIKVPKLTLPDGINQGEVSSSSTSEKETTTLQYQFPLKLEKEGSHKIGPIELSYSPRVGGKERFSRNEGFTIEVRKPELARVAVSILSGIVIVLIGGAFVLTRLRKQQPHSPSSKRDWNTPFEQIRQMKMRGETTKYMVALLKLNLEVDEERGEKNSSAQSLLEKIQFGGYTLSEAELLSFEKRIEKLIKESA